MILLLTRHPGPKIQERGEGQGSRKAQGKEKCRSGGQEHKCSQRGHFLRRDKGVRRWGGVFRTSGFGLSGVIPSFHKDLHSPLKFRGLGVIELFCIVQVLKGRKGSPVIVGLH